MQNIPHTVTLTNTHKRKREVPKTTLHRNSQAIENGEKRQPMKITAYQGHPQSLLTKHDKKGSSLIFNIHGEYIIIRKWNNVRN